MALSELPIGTNIWIYDDISDTYFQYEVYYHNKEEGITRLKNNHITDNYDNINKNDYVLTDIFMRDIVSSIGLYMRNIKLRLKSYLSYIKDILCEIG